MSILNLHKVISVGANINSRIVGTVVFPIVGEGVTFIPEATFKENLVLLLDNPLNVKQLSEMFATLEDYNNFVKEGRIVLQSYEIIDPSTPESIIPMVF